MISFTGFSTTADLTKNSDIAYAVDYDVGVDVAILVERNLLLNEIVIRKETQYFARGVSSYDATISYSNTNDFKRKEDPISTISNLTEFNQETFRLARDGFNY